MKALTDEDKIFCKAFVKTFNFHESCTSAKVNRATTLAKVTDDQDPVNIYIRNMIDEKQVANVFVTKEVITSGLINIFMEGEDKHKLQSAKLLLSLSSGGDKTKGFKDLINAITKGR